MKTNKQNNINFIFSKILVMFFFFFVWEECIKQMYENVILTEGFFEIDIEILHYICDGINVV
jgi:hypothetical protein